jgi:hypothetical protein
MNISVEETVVGVEPIEDEVVNVSPVEESIATVEVNVGEIGPPGPQGEQGPAGPEGPAGGEDLNYIHNFTFEDTVDVQHNLGKYPAVTVFDSAGEEVEGEVDHIDINRLIISFTNPFTGMVILN